MQYKLENEKELENTIFEIAENWTDFKQTFIEKEELDGYEIADQAKYEAWWKQYTEDVADDISGWIRDEYDITFDDDDDADGDAVELRNDVAYSMEGNNRSGHGYDDGIDDIVGELEKAGAIRKIEEEDVAED